MTGFSTIPKVVDVRHLAGDTLTLRVLLPVGFDDGLEWHAQVRSAKGSSVVDAEFDILTDPDPQVRYLVLASAETRRLADSGVSVVDNRTGRTRSMVYSGHWDVQVSGPGGVDPVTTLAGGALILELDVTRT